jgi:hypothetical protein
VEQMVEAQHYTPEGRGFDWNLSLTSSFRPHFDPKVDSASNRNENQEYLSGGGGYGGRCVGLTTLPHSCVDCVEMWEPPPPGTLRPVEAYHGIALPFIRS